MNTRSKRKVLEIHGGGTTNSTINMTVPHYLGKFEAKINLPIPESTTIRQALNVLKSCLDNIDNMITLNQTITGHQAHELLQHAFYTFLIVTAIKEHGEKTPSEKPAQ